MNWLDDDMPSRVTRRRGRPEVSPFPSDEVEKDFVVRGRKMIELYYDDSDPKSKNNFVFAEHKHMSKTLFWSLMFTYYVEQKGFADNLKGFVAAVTKHFGTLVISDRTSLLKCIGMLDGVGVTKTFIDEGKVSTSERKAMVKYRSAYQFVVREWERCIG